MLIDDFYIRENIKILLIFLSEKISPKQLEFFGSKKEQLKKYDLMILTKESTEKFKIIDQNTTDRPIIDILMEVLNDRLIKKERF